MTNRTYRFTAVYLILITACLVSAAKGQPVSDAEKLKDIFSAALEAGGGEKEIGKVRSIEAYADCTGPKGMYTTEVISYRSNKTIFDQKFTYRESGKIVVNNDLIWERANKTGEFSLASPMSRLVVRLHEFQLMSFDFQKMFRDFALAGTENFAGRPSVKVLAKTELDGPIHLFFDTETKLLSGYILPIPGSSESVKNVFKDWKKVGKLKLPSVVTATDKAGTWELRFHTITLNKTDAKVFDVPGRVKDLSELLKLQEQQKTAHLTYNAELFADMFNERVTQLKKGAVSTATKAENLSRFKNYFAQFKFLEWEDIRPPVIRLSRDGTMATVIVEKRVRGTYKDENGQEKTGLTEFAWLEVWEKIDGKWKLMTVASTEKPT